MKTKAIIFLASVEQSSKSQKTLSAKKKVTKHANKIMGQSRKAEFDIFLYNKPISMKQVITFFLFLTVGLGYAQDYFIDEDFVKSGKIKFSIPFTPDWTKDFFIEANVKIVESQNPSTENVGLLFGFDETTKSFYGIYIQNSSKQLKEYADYFLLKSQNTSNSFDKNEEWQLTSLVNHNAFNRLQIYKIHNELFFGINDQVVAHVQNMESKGNLLKLVTGEKGISATYVKAYYLAGSNNSALKSQLENQLQLYNETKIHHKIAPDYSKVVDLNQPEKIPEKSFHNSSYNPELGYVEAGGVFYDVETSNVLSSSDILARYKKTVFRNNVNRTAEIILPNQPLKTLEGYEYIGELNDSEILIIDSKLRVHAYNYKTQNFRKLFKADYGNHKFLSHNKQYLCVGWYVFSMTDGKKIEYKTPEIPYKRKEILSCFDDNIILKLDAFSNYKINLKTGENERIYKIGSYQNEYFIETNGRELNITNLSTNQQVVENIQLLTKDPEIKNWDKIIYHPEINEAYVSTNVSLIPNYYFSYNDAVKNTSSFVVNTKTNEITPFLLFKTSTELKKNTEENAANKAKAKQEVDEFFNQLKPFGSSYTLDYNNFDYVNVSHNSLLNKYGIGGTTYAIGKFCHYNGGSFLALGITNDQYTVELIAITYQYDGKINVRRHKLGLTQKVNGVTTQVAEASVRRNSQDKTKYTLTVNDGKKTEMTLTSNCE